MKLFKIIASFLLILIILFLVIWAVRKTNDQVCTGISTLIRTSGETQLISESDVLAILKQNNIEWEGRKIKEVDLDSIHKILAQENYIKSVEKVHFSGSKLQIEISLYNILLNVKTKDGKKFLLDDHGVYLPFSPKVGNGVMTAAGFIPISIQKKETVTLKNYELYSLFSVATLLKADENFATEFKEMNINEKQEITLFPDEGKLPVLIGTMQNADKKLNTLRYMYKEVLPYLEDGKYKQLDVRFENRIVATKSES